MPSTEIDAIFASKALPAHAGKSSSLTKSGGKAKTDDDTSSVVKKKSKKKKKKSIPEQEDRDLLNSHAIASTSVTAIASKRKRTEPETIIDPSTPAAPSKRSKTAYILQADAAPSSFVKKKATSRNEDEQFRDSRGTGPRLQTEEGFSIYKEGELGIGDQGGDTPLCPFDCDCCF
ncbi:DUF1764-domain-containing protein [Ramaria rubella]|nr:DUF1764-domain-containing protein [Ramaria rubella]